MELGGLPSSQSLASSGGMMTGMRLWIDLSTSLASVVMIVHDLIFSFALI